MVKPSFTVRRLFGLRVMPRLLITLEPAIASVAIARFGTVGSPTLPPSAVMVAFMSVMPCSETSHSAGRGPSGILLPTTAALMAASPPMSRASISSALRLPIVTICGCAASCAVRPWRMPTEAMWSCAYCGIVPKVVASTARPLPSCFTLPADTPKSPEPRKLSALANTEL